MLPDVSVVITTHNDGEHLYECLESVIAQEGVTFETVLVLDEEPDVARGILDRLAALGCSSLRAMCPGRLGRSRALNVGCDAARGLLIAIMDADDIMLPGRLREQARFLEEQPDIEAVGGQLEQFGDWGSAPFRFTWPTSTETADRWIRHGRMPVPHPTLMMRRELYERVGGYDPDCVRVQDLDLLMRGWRPGAYVNLATSVTRYRTASSFPSFSYWAVQEGFRRRIVRRVRSGSKGLPALTMWDRANIQLLGRARWLAARTLARR